MDKVVVFDLGNVLLEFKPTKYLSRIITDQKNIDFYYQQVFLSPEWLELDRGTLTQEQAIKAICLRNPSHKDQIEKVFSTWLDILTPIEPMVDLLRRVKKYHRVYALSNFHQAAIKHVTERYLWFRLFDGITVSCLVKANKPEEEIYRALFSEHRLRPEQCVFIDDSLENIQAARKLGMIGIHFQNPKQCQDELKKAGIDF